MKKKKVKIEEIIKEYLEIEKEIKILRRKRKAIEKINKKEFLQLLSLIDQKIKKRREDIRKMFEKEITF